MGRIIHIAGGPITQTLLVAAAKNAAAVGMKYMGVLTTLPNTPKPELLIDPSENFEAKLEYIASTYDDNLSHKYSKGVTILEVKFANSLSDFETLL
jgi:hypothetical protein